MTDILDYKISEEIARFTFEINLKVHAPEWFIGFSNPSAGPWKKISFQSNDKIFELGRYERDEQRPDIIIFNYEKGISIIIEAKDNLDKLISDNQMVKSVNVYNKEKKRILSSDLIRDWVSNKNVVVTMGFLWAAKQLTDVIIMKQKLRTFSQNNLIDPALLIPINATDEGLSCYGNIVLNGQSDFRFADILSSLNLKEI